MSEYLKSTDYVNAYDLARDRRVISGKVRLTDMPRLREEICPTDAECVFEIKGMTAKKGWPGAVMTLAAKVPLICNHCGKPMEFPIESDVLFRFARDEKEADSIPIDDEDDTEVIVGSEKLNLMEWIEEEILLSLPYVPVHDYACKSDIEAPKEEEPKKENPFAKLKDLQGLRKN